MDESSNNASVEMENSGLKLEEPTVENEMKGVHGPGDVPPDGGWAAWGCVLGLFCCSYVDSLQSTSLINDIADSLALDGFSVKPPIL